MKTLPPALAGLNEYPKFIGWRAEMRDGKLIKVPTNHLGDKIDINDARYYMTFETAAHYAAQVEGLNVGYVFTDQDPFFFIDIDKCNDGGTWSGTAEHVLSLFPGAAVEVSQSGNGLHIFGRGVAPPHSSRNKEYGLEFYTEKRFVALTGRDAIGDINTEHMAALSQFGPRYFPPRPEYSSADWTTEASEFSRPIKTDKALLSKALASTSKAEKFGVATRATFKQLWEADADVLAEIWPPENPHSAFDHSYADMALCQHLSFWTGGNCQRIEDLFSKSALVRDKWLDREDYRRGTITLAASRTREFYGAAKAAKEAAAITGAAAGELPKPGRPGRFLDGQRVLPFEGRDEYFKGHVFLTGRAEVFCPDGYIRGMTAYNAVYGGREFAEKHGGKPIRKPWDAYVDALDSEPAVAEDITYRPEYAFGAIIKDEGIEYVNSHLPTPGPRKVGDPSPFLDHLNTILPDGRDAEILLSWCAAFIQYPGVKFLWAPLIQGVEGNGKSLFGRILTHCIGVRHHTDIDPVDLCATGGKFNKWIMGNRLATIEELKTESRVNAEATLKRLITGTRIQMQSKGVDQITVRSIINFLITTNHKDAILITDTTRRIAPLFTAQQTKADLFALGMQTGGAYFKQLIPWLKSEGGWAICHEYLKTYEIPDELNPAGDCDKAPETTALLDAIQASKTVRHLAVAAACGSGIPGTRGDWVSVGAINRFLKDDNDGRRASPHAIGKFLRAEGYVKHPLLTDQGRLTRPIMEEGNVKPTVYLKPGHIALNLTTAGAVTEAYVKAQGYSVAGGALSIDVTRPTTI